MKKIIALIIAAAMLIALATIGVSADEGRYVWSDTGAYAEDPWNHTFRIGNDDPLTGSIRFKTDVSFSKIQFAKIWSKAEAPISIELVSGGSAVFSDSFALLAENGSGDVANVVVDLGKTLPAGEYTLNLSVDAGAYAFFAYGNQPLPDDFIEYERGRTMFGLYTTDSGNGFVSLGLVIEEKTVDVFNGSGDGGPQNLQGGPIAVVITVPEGYKLAEIIGLNSPTWSNPDGGSDATVEVYAWDGDYDSSVGGAMLASAEVIDHPDNGNAVFALDNALSAGSYLAEFSATGEKPIGFWSFGAAEGDAYVFQNGNEVTTFYPKMAVKLVLDAQPATEPETQPATEPAGGLRDFDAGKGDLMSYDQILVNGAEIANGNDAVIAAKALVDGSDGSVQTIAMHGWFGNKNAKIDSFGYMIDDKAPVFGDFKVDAEQAVIDAGGEYRYTITVDVSGITDGKTHKIQAVVKLENGDIVKMNRNADGKDRDAYVNYKAQLIQEETQPATGDVTVAMFAVIAVLAMGAAVVFMKKRAF